MPINLIPKDVRILSTIEYAGRILGQIVFQLEYREKQRLVSREYTTYLYRSTGTNVSGEGMWFPFSSISGPGAISRKGHQGWIQKDVVYSSEGDSEAMTLVQSTCSIEEHCNPEARLNNFKLPWNLPELSQEVQRIYDTELPRPTSLIEHPISPEDAGYINDWLIKGLLYRSKKKLEMSPEERSTQEIINQLSMMM